MMREETLSGSFVGTGVGERGEEGLCVYYDADVAPRDSGEAV